MSNDYRMDIARAIVGFEARRDKQGRIAIYKLPPGDGGGAFEVAGICDRYHPHEAEQLAQLIRDGKHAEAETRAAMPSARTMLPAPPRIALAPPT